MPVGEMLRQMDARELAEWRAYFSLKRKKAQGPKKDAAAELRARFANRIVKKKRD